MVRSYIGFRIFGLVIERVRDLGSGPHANNRFLWEYRLPGFRIPLQKSRTNSKLFLQGSSNSCSAILVVELKVARDLE